MKFVEANGVTLAYREAGSGPETVVLSHSFLVDHRQFDHQIETLSRDARVIAFDHRDHGASARVTRGYALSDLVRDGEAVLERLDATPCHFVGLSTGGFVGMRLAIRSPELFRSLTLMDTSAQRERPARRAKNEGLRVALAALGTRPLLGAAMRTMFSRSFLENPERRDEVALWRSRIAANDPKALRRFGKAIFARDDVTDQLRSMPVPTLVMVGREDSALPVGDSETMARLIPDARLAVVPDAGHLCTIEQPEAVEDVLVPFIRSHASRG